MRPQRVSSTVPDLGTSKEVTRYNAMTMILDNAHLVPKTWADGPLRNCYVFNPAIVLFRGRFILAYRVVTPDGVRRIAICELEAASLQPKSETIVPLSDLIQNGGH